MPLPRSTKRRILRLVALIAAGSVVLLGVSAPAIHELALLGIGLLWLLGLAITLPFMAYELILSRSIVPDPKRRRRPPRLPRVTTRRLTELIVVITVVFGVAVALGRLR